MISMWEEIKNSGIIAYITNSNGQYMSSIPEGTASLSATRIINMIKWIYEDFTKDCSTHPKIFQENYSPKQEDFIVRNMSRTLSYVNHVCLMEHILEKLYEETISKLRKIDPQIQSDETELSLRKDEVKDCFIFRNKLSAHTAYGSPLPNDNDAMKFHSLVSLLNSSYDGSGNPDSFAVGAVSVKLSGQTPSTQLPCVGLKDLHPKILVHIKKWTDMFTKPSLEARKKLPITIGDTTYKF